MKQKHTNKYILVLEEFKESPTYRAGKLLQSMLDKLAMWFKQGTFSKESVQCTYLEKSDTDTGLQSILSARFHDKRYYYALAITAMTADMVQGPPASVHLALKRYRNDDAQLLNTVSDDVAPDEFTEDYMLGKLADVNKPQDLEADTEPSEEPAQDDADAVPAEGGADDALAAPDDSGMDMGAEPPADETTQTGP
jgi:hypothetical protein